MFRRRRIEIKSPDQLRVMRSAGLVVAEALRAAAEAAVVGATTRDLDSAAARVIAEAGARSNFLGYYGYPATICVSVNDEVIHGIPGSRELRDGDLVSIDGGAIVDGWHGDAAVTVEVGDVRAEDHALSEATRAALAAGISAARVGATIGDIGFAVQSSLAAASSECNDHRDPAAERRAAGATTAHVPRYGIVTGYTGHGIGSALHMEPDVPNRGRPGRGPRLLPGMTLAIEPMITLGPSDIDELDDGWTVVTRSGRNAAHWEHTVAITPDGPWVLTAGDAGAL